MFKFLILLLAIPIFFIFGLPVLLTIFWLWMLVDCGVNETNYGHRKIIWLIVIAFTHSLGAGIYYFTARRDRLKFDDQLWKWQQVY